MKTLQQIQQRLNAEQAAFDVDPTLKENQFLLGYVALLKLCKHKNKDFMEGITEGIVFVFKDEKK